MQEGQTEQENMDFVRREYGTGGKGFTIDGTDYAVWFDELGMQIAQGDSALETALDKAFLTWEDVAVWIRQLLWQG